MNRQQTQLSATYTFRATPTRLRAAQRHASAQGSTLAQVIRGWLDEFVAAEGERPPAWARRLLEREARDAQNDL